MFVLICSQSSGYIDLEELKLIVGCLLADEIQSATSSEDAVGAPITVRNIEELFNTIDQNGNDKINYEEFNTFFETILRSPTIITSSYRGDKSN